MPPRRTAAHRRVLRFDALGAFPKPSPGAIPIRIGGHTDRAFRRIAELGDGWHAAFPAEGRLENGLARLREACRRAGRDFSTRTISARIGVAARRPSDEVLAELEALDHLGVQHVVLETRVRDLSDLTAIYERFAREVRPRL